MNQMTKVALLLGVFFLGCAAERLIIPPARAGTSPTRWEYFCKGAYPDEEVTKVANAAGQQGWEMAAAGAAGQVGVPIWCFKRALP
jgi:hypothetical protein